MMMKKVIHVPNAYTMTATAHASCAARPHMAWTTSWYVAADPMSEQ
jgi:hypothetical protein